MKIEKIDVHAKYNQRRCGRESQGAKYLPRGPQPTFRIGKIWLTSSKITHNFAEELSISLSEGNARGYAHLTVDRSG